MNIPLLAGTGCYMIGMLMVGWFASRKIHGLSDFLVAGRRLNFPLALGTLFATWFGAGTCMGAAGTAYSEGILGVIADPFAAGISLLIAGFFYVGLLRRLNLLTVTDVFGKYYGKKAEIFASALMIPVYIGWLGSQNVALGYLLHVMTGIDTTVGIILSTFIVLIYTYSGGMWAVTLTDIIQVVILIAGLLLIFPVVLFQIGGWDVLVRETPSEFWHFFPHQANYDDWTSYIGQWAILGLGTVVGQDLIQRSLSSKNESVAKQSACWSGFLYLTVGLIPVFLGFAGRIVFPDIADPEMILPSLASEFLPTIPLILFIGALISAIMSSADSSLIAASSLITNNILYRIFPDAADQTILRWARFATIATGILSMMVALYVKQIYDLMVNSWATLFFAILAPVTFALYWKKANSAACWASMLCGCTVWIGWIAWKSGNFFEIPNVVFYQASLYGGVASFMAYLLVTYAFYSRIPSQIPATQYDPC